MHSASFTSQWKASKNISNFKQMKFFPFLKNVGVLIMHMCCTYILTQFGLKYVQFLHLNMFSTRRGDLSASWNRGRSCPAPIWMSPPTIFLLANFFIVLFYWSSPIFFYWPIYFLLTFLLVSTYMVFLVMAMKVMIMIMMVLMVVVISVHIKMRSRECVC